MVETVTAATCGECHDDRLEQFSRGKHALAVQADPAAFREPVRDDRAVERAVGRIDREDDLLGPRLVRNALHRTDDGSLRPRPTEVFEDLEVGPDGVDWSAAGLVGPSSTWTYQVSDTPFGENTMRGLANRAGAAAIGAAAAAPFLFLWGLVLHWKRWRLKARLAKRDS